MSEAYLAFGANIDEPEKNIRLAYEALAKVPGIKFIRASSFYKTEPWGYLNQPDFTNSCALIETDLPPEGLLGVCLGIEAALGRVRSIKNGPRIIDIDLLIYDDIIINTDFLTLPHPRMWERSFVLEPLSELTDTEELKKRF